jgi:ATP-dependent Zn protease
MIDTEVRKMLEAAQTRVRGTLTEKRDLLDSLAER